MPKHFSTKTLKIIENATNDHTGIGIFEFTDNYSVFHYGKMPDSIPFKGESICRMADYNFQLYKNAKIKTHFRRFLSQNKIEIQLFQIFAPHLGELKSNSRNYLIPLQIIFRNALPGGASIFRRLDRKQISLKKLGLKNKPIPGDLLKKPIIEFTTKLEEIDRFISEEEAMDISFLSKGQMQNLKEITLQINDIITMKANAINLKHADGKIEFGLDHKKSFVLVDVAGTSDDNRFIYKNYHLSKQVLRNYYLKTSLEVDVQNWAKMGCSRKSWPNPNRLPKNYIGPISELYMAICELWIGKKIWRTSTIDSAINSILSIDEKLILSS